MSEIEEEKNEEEVEEEIEEKNDEKSETDGLEDEEVKHISFGITKGNSYNFGTATANAVFRINAREEIITTSREIIRVDSGVIVNRAPHKSCTGVYCPIYDALVTITTVRSVFSVFLLNYDIREPVVTGISLDQIGICHVLFDERNSTIVTFGNGIKTWYLDCLPRASRRTIMDNYANIRPRASFAQFHTSFAMVIPCLDTYNHRVFIPTQDGLLCYDYDGKFLQPPIQHNNHWFTMFSFNPYNKKMLTSDRDEAKESKAQRAAQFKKQIVTQGVQYWREDGTLSKELTFTNASLFAAFFIDKEFAVTVDSSFYVHIVDMKTMKFFTCCQIECRPNHIFFQNDTKNVNLVICSASNVYYYKICVPWKLWLLTHIPPTMIQRCPRFESAARIAVQFIDSSVRLFTPYAILLTLCHSANPASPTCVLVDRGNEEFTERDQVFVVLENGIVQKFSANECPCLPATTMNLKAHCCCIAEVFGSKSFLFGSKIGDIMVYDYEKMNFLRRIICCEGEILFLFHHEQSKSLLALTDYKLYRVSTVTGKVICSYYQKCHKCAALFDDLLIVGYENGSYLIQRILDEDGSLVPVHKSKHPLHSGRVVGLSKGSNYFVSAGFDGSILVWDMHAIVLVMLSLPSPIYSIGVHNGFRGLLVGTDTEIMFIDGKLLFDDFVDPEDSVYDNYDKKRDYLLGEKKSLFDDENEEEEIGQNGNKRSNRRNRKRSKKGSNDDDDLDDLDVGPGRSKGRGRKSQYAAMMERMKKQKEEQEQQELEKQKQQDEQQQQEEEQQNENIVVVEEEEVDDEKQEEENLNENKRRKRKIRRKNNNGEYDEQYEYVDEKGNPVQNNVISMKKNDKKDDDDVDYTEVKEGLHILAGKEKVVVENLMDPKPLQIDEELKKRIYAEEDAKEEKEKKKKKEKEKEEKEKAEKQKKKSKSKNENDDDDDEETKTGKKKSKGKKSSNDTNNNNKQGNKEKNKTKTKNKNGENADNNDDNDSENEEEDEDETETENENENETNNENNDDENDNSTSKKGASTKKGKSSNKGETEGQSNDVDDENNDSPDKKNSPKKPSKPSGQESHKQNPRNKKIRQNYNDPNANPKFNANLTNQVIDGDALNEDGAASDTENGGEDETGEKGGKKKKGENDGKAKGKEKGKSGSKKGKKGKSAGGRDKGFSHGGLDENGNKITDKRYGGPESGQLKGKSGGQSGGYQNGSGGGYQGANNGAGGGGYQGGPSGGYGNGQGGSNGYQNGPGGYQGGPNGYQGGPNNNYQGGPNGGYQNGPGGYQGGPNGGYQNGPNGYQGGPNGSYQGGPNGNYQNGPGGYQGGPNNYQGGPNGNYQNGPNGYQGGPNGGYQGGPNGYQGGPNGGYQNGPNGYQGGPNGGFQGGSNGYQNGPGGYNGPGYQGGPNGGYANGQNGYQNGPNGYNGSGSYQAGPNGEQTTYQNGQGGPNGYNNPNGYQGGPHDPTNPNAPGTNQTGPNAFRGTQPNPHSNIGTSPIDHNSPHRHRHHHHQSAAGQPSSSSASSYTDDGSRVTRRRPNSSSSSASPSSLRSRRERLAALQRKRSQTPSGRNLYDLHHIIHVHLRVNRDFPPDVDIRKAVNPPCLVYSPEYLALALGDDDEDDDQISSESRWDKFKRMCFFSGVNDFAHESFRRQKHFMLTNSNRLQTVKPSTQPLSFTQSSPRIAQIYQTDYDPLKKSNLNTATIRYPQNIDLDNGQLQNQQELSSLPLLNIRNTSNVEYDFDFKSDMLKGAERIQPNSARSVRSVRDIYRNSPNSSSRRGESRRSLFPFLDDEMLRPGTARKPQTPVRIINPTGGSKQAYRNLFSIFKKVKKH